MFVSLTNTNTKKHVHAGRHACMYTHTHLLIDLDGLRVLLQLSTVGPHLQQTFVCRAASEEESVR